MNNKTESVTGVVSSPDPPHHTPSKNFPTGRGAKGLGTRLLQVWDVFF